MSDFLVCENVEKVYNDSGKKTRVLKSISLEFRRGGFTAVTGPSGAGKSTLLHIMGAIDSPTSGSVLFEGRDIHKLGERRLAAFRNSKIGFIFQFYHLLPEFTVLENVLLPSLAAGRSGGGRREKALELIESVGLAGHESHYCSELSGGEMQRAAICRALINEPDVILADEPTGNLDSANSSQIIKILKGLSENEGRTLIIATHDRELAENAGNIAALTDGRLEGIEEMKTKKGEDKWG
jgi:lipoprotein-releasing system ATP-binding protein